MANMFAEFAPPAEEPQRRNMFEEFTSSSLPQAPAPPPPEPPGDVVAGAKTAIGQNVPLAMGTVAAVGGALEQFFGKGGISTGLKNWALEGYTSGMQKLEQYQQPNHDVTVAWEKVKQGDLGAMVDFVQYAFGYGMAQMGEAAALALVGSLIGAATGGPVGAAVGAAGGLAAKGTMKSFAARWVADAVGKMTVESGGKLTVKEAAKKLAGRWGENTALAAYSQIQELGTTYAEAEAEAKARGYELTGEEVAKAWGAGITAGLTEFGANRFALDAVLGRNKRLAAAFKGMSLGGKMLTGAAATGGVEIGTELTQTGLERFGAGKPLTGEEANREYANAAAMALVPGGLIGSASGALSHQRAPQTPPPPPSGPLTETEIATELGRAQTVDEAIAIAGALTDTGAPMTEGQLLSDRALMVKASEEAQEILRNRDWDTLQAAEGAIVGGQTSAAFDARERRVGAVDEAQRAAGQGQMLAAAQEGTVEAELAAARAAGMETPAGPTSMGLAMDREVSRLSSRLMEGDPARMRTTQLEVLASRAPDPAVRQKALEIVSLRRNADRAAFEAGVETQRTELAPQEGDQSFPGDMSRQRDVQSSQAPEIAGASDYRAQLGPEHDAPAVARLNEALEQESAGSGKWQIADLSTLPVDDTPHPGSPVGAVSRSRESVQLAQGVGDMLGLRVLPMRNLEARPGEFMGGTVLGRDGNRVYVNVDSPDASPVVTVGHEASHKMEEDHPDLARAMRTVIGLEGKQTLTAEHPLVTFYRSYEGGDNLTDDQIVAELGKPAVLEKMKREISADFFGNRAGEYKTLQTIFKAIAGSEDKGLIYKVANYIVKFIDSVLRRMKTQKFEVSDALVAKLVKDLEGAKQATREIMAEYAKRQGLTKMQAEAAMRSALVDQAAASVKPAPRLDKNQIPILSKQRKPEQITPAEPATPKRFRLRATPEKLRSIGLEEQHEAVLASSLLYGPEPKHIGGIPEVVLHLEERARKVLGRKLDLTQEADRELTAAFLAAEAYEAFRRRGNAAAWYDEVIDEMMGYAMLAHEELATSADLRTVFTLAMAITSQGQNVDRNIITAEQQFAYFKDKGRFKLTGWGTSAGDMVDNFRLINQMLDNGLDMADIRRFMATPFKAQELQRLGFSISELGDEPVLGSSVLGPKIGFGFFSNLNGNFDPVTMDMWFMRLIGRLTGNLRSYDAKLIGEQTERLRAAQREVTELSAEGKPQLSAKDIAADAALLEGNEDDVAVYAYAVVRAHEADYRKHDREYASGDRVKSELVLAASALKTTLTKPTDAPGSGGERRRLRDVVKRAVTKLETLTGRQIKPASVQAVVWYPEQRLYQRLGVKLPVIEQNYAEGMRDLLKSKGYTDAQLDATKRGSRGAQPADVATVPARARETREATRRPVPLSGKERSTTAFKLAEKVNGLTPSRVYFEVAPSPADIALTAVWDALPMNSRIRISDRIAHLVIPKAAAAAGVMVRIRPQLGGWQGKTNPSFTLEYLGPPSGLIRFAGLVGYVLSQQAMVSVSHSPFVGSTRMGAVTVNLTDSSSKAVSALYRTLWNKVLHEGKKIVVGHTTVGDQMAILNTSPISTEDFASLVHGALDGKYDVRHDIVFAKFSDAKEYDYGRNQGRGAAPGRASLQGDAHSLHAEVGGLLRAELGLAKSAQRSGIGADAGERSGFSRRPQQADAAEVTGVHYGRERTPVLSGSKYGTGIRGAEAQRLANSSDPRIKRRVYFYIAEGDKLPRPETGLGIHTYRQKLSNLYDPATGRIETQDPNLFESAVLDGGYDGYVNHRYGMAVVLDADVPVEYLGQRDALSRDVADLKKSKQRTDTPVFKKWFGDSKVVDANGEPLRVFHGASAEFDVFEPRGPWGSAFFFTAYRRYADRVAETKGGPVVEVYLSISNPAIIPAQDYAGLASIEEAMAREGHDGVVVLGHDGKPDTVVAFRPEQIKSVYNEGAWSPTDPRISKSQQRTPLWFSPLTKAIEGINARSQPASAWASQIASLKGIKPDEVEWSGVTDWLALQQGKVTREALLEYLAGNGVRVEETVLGDPETEDVLLEREARRVLREDGIENPTAEQVADFIEEHGYDIDDVRDAQRLGATKFAGYRVPGRSENYRELLLTLPMSDKFDPAKVTIERRRQSTTQGSLVISYDGKQLGTWDDKIELNPQTKQYEGMTDEQAIGIVQRRFNGDPSLRIEPLHSGFRSSHWDQPNVIAHVRFDERTDAEGKRVLFINELQSDWGQRGRKEGFAQKGRSLAEIGVEQSEVTRKRSTLIDEAAALPDSEMALFKRMGGEIQRLSDRLRALNQEWTEAQSDNKPPRAPFIEKTDAWVALALKRVILTAVEEGFDRVALVNGEQAAEMFDLSKQISEVQYDPKRKLLKARDLSDNKVLEETTEPDRIEDYIGKEAAKKLLATPLNGPYHQIAGDGLKVGGEGMHGFYDQIVPKVLKDVLKKLGGGKIGLVEIARPNASRRDAILAELEAEDGNQRPRTSRLSQPGFDVTQTLREAAAKGMPLFSKQRKVKLQTTPDPAGVYHSITELVAERTRTLPVDRVTTPQQAALALASVADYAVEHFQGLVTDKAGRPLALVGSFKGGLTSTQIYPGTLVSELFRIKGAASLWLTHNHPSGKAEFSGADRVMLDAIKKLLADTGVNVRGFFAQTYTKSSRNPGNWVFTADGGMDVFGQVLQSDIDAAEKVTSVPVVERVMAQHNPGLKVTTPRDAVNSVPAVQDALGQETPFVLFLSSQNDVIGAYPLKPGELKLLRKDDRAADLFRASSHVNAGAAVIVDPAGKLAAGEAENVSRALVAIGIPALDYLRSDGRQLVSENERGYWSAPTGMFKSQQRVTDSAAFKRWSDNAPLIKLGEEHTFRSGEPVVVEVLHGTTNANITAFDRSKAFTEADWGAGFYASNNPAEVAANYANNEGPDLTNKLALLAERIEGELENEPEWADRSRREIEKEAHRLAAAQITDRAPNTLKLFMRFRNPLVIGGEGETFFDYSEPYNEDTEEYGEPTGLLFDFTEALREVSAQGSYSAFDIELAVADIYDTAEGEGLSAGKLRSVLQESEGLSYAADEEGNLVSTEILRKALEAAGFDGVIDNTVDVRFGSQRRRGLKMAGMNPDTAHFVAFQPEQIKSVFNEGTWSPTDPRISKSQPRINIGTLTAAQQATAERVGAIVEPVTWQQRLDGFKKDLGLRLQQGIFDQFAPIAKLDYKAYMASRMSKGSDGTLEASVIYGLPVMRGGVPDVSINDRGFGVTLATLGKDMDRFFWWVAAKRAKELKAAGKENLFSDTDISNFETLNLPDAESPDRVQKFDEALVRLNEFNEAMLKIARDSDLLDDAGYQLFKDQIYVPFYRVMEDGVAGPGFGSGLTAQYMSKKLLGGSEALNQDLLANVLQNWAHLLSAAAKNRAAVATAEAAVPLGVMEQVPAGTPKSVRIRVAGVEQHFLVHDPHLLSAISAITYATPSWFKPFSTVKRMLTIGVTANPAFKIRNLIRDSVQSIATGKLDPNVFANVARGWSASSPKSQTYASMLASGGMIRFGSSMEGARSSATRRLAMKMQDPSTLLDESGWEALQRKMSDLVDAYQELGDRSENVNRNALYEQLIGKGYSHMEAAFMARDLMDFQMGGMWPVVRFLAQSVPFLNARLQGLYKLGKSAKDDPVRVGYTVGAVVLASLVPLLVYGDDDDWKKREDWDRDNYWWFKIGDQAFRIPKPFEIGAIGTMAERTWELMFDKEMTSSRYGRRIVHTITEQFAMNPTPQIVKPLVDLYANKDSFTGREIESMGMEARLPEDRARASTSVIAMAVGKLGLPNPAHLASARYEPLSPVQVDHMVRAYFGWLGTAIVAGLDYGLRPMTDRGPRPEMRLKDVFLAGGFVESLPAGSSRYVTQMYEQARQADQWWASYRAAAKYGDAERAAEIMAEHRADLGKRGQLVGLSHAVTQLGEQVRRIEASRSLSPETKRKMIDALEQRRNELARRAPTIN